MLGFYLNVIVLVSVRRSRASAPSRAKNAASPSYSAHSRDSETTIVQGIESTYRSGVPTAPFTRSPRVSLCPYLLVPKTRRRSALPPLSARRWWRRLTADGSPP